MARYVECLTLNEFGDFLAGAFAPLAFLWLMIAVLIQSNELQLQRQELAQNREVLKGQQAAADTQAKTLKETGTFIAKQTELMQSEWQDKVASRMDALFRARLQSLALLVQTLLPRIVLFDGSEGAPHSRELWDSEIQSANPYKGLRAFLCNLARMQKVSHMISSANDQIEKLRLALPLISSDLSKLEDLKSELTPEALEVASALPLTATIVAIEQIRSDLERLRS